MWQFINENLKKQYNTTCTKYTVYNEIERLLAHTEFHNELKALISSSLGSGIGRVTTHLENLEKSGNSKVVREKSRKMEKGKVGKWNQVCFFKL